MAPFKPRTLNQCLEAVGDAPPAVKGSLWAEGLFKVLGKPRPGDWLESHEEIGQSFNQYAQSRSRPQLPRPGCEGLLLCPFGQSFAGPLGASVMAQLQKYCAAFFPGIKVEWLPKVLNLKDVRRRENDSGHKQYLIGDMFQILNSHKDVVSKRNAYCRLGVTLEDIYPGDEWNYVFGQARLLERVGVFSFARHSPVFYSGVHALDAKLSQDQEQKWMMSCFKTMVHETGHMLGMKHCIYFKCLMNGSNGPSESAGSAFFCPVCMHKLIHALAAVWRASLPAIDSRYAEIQAALQELAGSADTEETSLGRSLAWLAARRAQLAADPKSKIGEARDVVAAPGAVPSHKTTAECLSLNDGEGQTARVS